VRADDPLPLALSEWQRKHGIADNDPLIAVLDLVRLAVLHPPKSQAATASLPPSFEEFRSTMELLEANAKEFVKQSSAVIVQQRAFALTLQRLNRNSAGTVLMMTVLGFVAGVAIGWQIWAAK
jgi:hypothetical protein